MKKALQLFLISFTLNSFATHNRAGEILYKRIAPFTVGGVAVYTYSFSVIKYTDHGQNIADRCEDTLHFGDGTSAILPRVNGLTNGCSCGTIPCGEIIINSPGYIVKKNIYTGTHTYVGVGNYLAYTMDPNRNAGVINIPNSVNIPFYIESLIIVNSYINSSPIFANPPIDKGVLNACYYHNPCAYDIDGDSLSYEITQCRSGYGNPANGYTYPTTGAGGSFSINPLTGLLTWCTPQLTGEYNIAIIVREWRKNACNSGYSLMGYVLRDMQTVVSAIPPVSFSSSNLQDTCIVAGTNFIKNFSVNTNCNVIISIYGSSNNSLTLPNSIITVTSGNGNFNSSYAWSPYCDAARNLPYQINVVFASDLPYPLQRFYKSFNLKVVPIAPVVYSVQANINNVQLFWNKPNCQPNLKGYNIYRKTGINSWLHSACETGVPIYTGFYLQDFKTPNDTTFIDTDFWTPPPNGTPGHYIVTTVLNDCSESFASINTVALIVGIKNNFLTSSDISVSPNPFQNDLQIHFNGKYFEKVESKIFSLEGKLVLAKSDANCNNNLIIKTSDFPQGLYFLQFKTEKGTVTKKLLKE